MGELFSTLKDLVNLGFAGVGIAVFLLIFILLIRDKPIDARKAKLYDKVLTWGVGFAVFCGIISLLGPLVDTRPQSPGNVRLRLAFSPDFESQALPPPKVRLPDGSVAEAGAAFTVPATDSAQVLQVGVDDALRQVQALRATTTTLTQSLATTRRQRDSLAAAAPAAPAALGARRQIQMSSQKAAQIERNVARLVDSGEFAQAARATEQLRTTVDASHIAVQELASPPEE